jgi:TatD DNase family protein
MTDGPQGWVDSHCHLPMLTGPMPTGPKPTGEAETADPAGEAVARAREAGVVGMICVGTNLETSRGAIADAARFADVRATVGLHPHDASELEAVWGRLEALAASDRVVGVGETGFDLHYNHSPSAEQEVAFREHIRLAHRLGRALVIHSRNAWHDTFRVLADEGVPERTVFHCFTGGPAEAERALALGAYLSFSGIVSFKNAHDVRAAAASTPLTRMLVETDAPFLAPVPHRGRENEPAFVVDVGTALAAAIAQPLSAVAAATRENAQAVFGQPA